MRQYEVRSFAAFELFTIYGTGEVDGYAIFSVNRALQATWKEKEGAVDAEDRVTIDFTGSVDGEEFEGGKYEVRSFAAFELFTIYGTGEVDGYAIFSVNRAFWARVA
jgi:hypothetical protein